MWATRTWREEGVVGAWSHVLEMPRAGWGHHGQRAFVLQHLGATRAFGETVRSMNYRLA